MSALTFEKLGHIARITLNRPEVHNADQTGDDGVPSGSVDRA